MSSYHFSLAKISRRDGQSITRTASYITGMLLHDCYIDNDYDLPREDVLYAQVFLPDGAPQELNDLQRLVNAIDQAERRKDARTGKEITASLPNELPVKEDVDIVSRFVAANITAHQLCAIAAIHSGRNDEDPSRSNPHVHIIFATRPVTIEGFSRLKDRENDHPLFLDHCREGWARIQNEAYERAGLDIHVDHRSFRDQGLDREPMQRLSYDDYQRELQGERTPAGDLNREITARNKEREASEHDRDFDPSK